MPYIFVGPTVTRPVKDPLAVVLLDNQLYMTAHKFDPKLTPFVTLK